ncbi:MAG: tRNA preQ1(34) S-adenosylmethionine ribosyltransferase-isomerase QueA [Clostridia bacterium]|nr:tRNA preQ1(34) S-adenosylmethionine ribosyltransferase-isomerase QueA [Clostridia bacterium]MBQ4542801.1 tRNA preQ1(34) S-adenosylmethionine ribosyltransferase-isomerase QueA [Clostridia bacterium]
MKLSEFDYQLPQELIAQKPLQQRDSSRMLVMDKKTGELSHRHFYDILEYLNEGDCLILNDSRVIPARLFGVREDTGSPIEFLLLSRKETDVWEVILKPGKKAKVGKRFVFGEGKLKAEVIDIVNDGNRLVRFEYEGLYENIIDEIGEMPLPPYIKEKLKDKERYQTVYSKVDGSSAAPTAGLHFTQDLLEKAKQKGVNVGFVTLHVGLGTFRPVKADVVENHKMHSEFYELTQKTADLINATKKNGNKVVAVGTTTCRTLETVAQQGELKASTGWTDIFIYPPFDFKVIDRLITNFHLPQSTLLMLISAFAGKENVFKAYNEAIKEKYRFFSFGDAMFIM